MTTAAQQPFGLASNNPRDRWLTPGEFSSELAEVGIAISVSAVRFRCSLPEKDPLHIKTNPYFPSRRYIPESELWRLIESKSHE